VGGAGRARAGVWGQGGAGACTQNCARSVVGRGTHRGGLVGLVGSRGGLAASFGTR
jgi:hypothetical protein